MPSQGLPSNYQVVLLDIEGTTTPISFVHDVMFPYVSNNICEFLDKKRDDPNIKPYIADLAKQSKEDAANGVEGVVVIDQDASQEEDVKRRVIKNVLWQMGIDRKIAPLKNFQGLMWKDGFANGELKGLVFEDAYCAITRWHETGKPVYIYSSGSVGSQKLLFGNSNHGDMLKYFSGHFDTLIGSKLEPSSYANIAREIGVSPGSVLFISDNIKEIEAASAAGMQVVVSVREGNNPLPEHASEKFILCDDFTVLN